MPGNKMYLHTIRSEVICHWQVRVCFVKLVLTMRSATQKLLLVD